MSCDVKDKGLSGGEGGGRKEHYRKEFVKRLVAFFLLILLGLGERYCYHPCFMDEEKKKNTQR